MAIPGFDKTFYLNAKLEQLQSDSATAADWAGKDVAFLEARLLNGFGLTAEAHYEQYGYQEDLAPNAFFNPAEYIRAKATDMFNDPASSYLTIDEAAADFVSIWNGNVYNHYLQYGEGENINPSNSFDVSAYLETKLADLQAKEATAAEWAGKSVADVAAAFKASGLTALEHFTKFGQDEGLSAPAVPAEEQVEVDTSVPGQVFSLTAGVDKGASFVGTDDDDTFLSDHDITNDVATLGALDVLNGGAGTDTLEITSADTTAYEMAAATISNVENITIAGAAGVTADVSGANVTGLETLAVTKATTATVTASSTQDVEVSGATGAIDVAGGKDVTVTDSTADQAITIGEAGAGTTNASGTISVTDSKQGAGAIQVDGGTDVTVDATAADDAGNITVGANTAASGVVSVAQTLNSDGTETAGLAGGDIAVTGGTSVDVTVNANSTAEAATSNESITIGDVTVTGDDSTTDVNVAQNANVETFTSEEVAEVAATQTLTFKALTAGQTTTVDGLTFTASEDLTAQQVAAAFANLTSTDTQSVGGPVENGIFTGELGTAGWTSGAANGANVVFTAPANGSPALIVTGGTVDPTSNYQLGTAASGGVESTNAVAYGDVTVADGGADSIANVTVNGYGNGSSVTSDVLETLTLANNTAGADIAVVNTSADAALTLNVDNITSATGGLGNAKIDLVDTGSDIVNVTINTTGSASNFILDADQMETLTINADANLTLDEETGGTDFGNVTSVDINGEASVSLADSLLSASGLNSFNAADNTGGVTATVTANGANVGDIEEYVFSAGNDTVTLDESTVNVDVTLGAGDDSVALASGTTALGAMVDGGEGTDTLALDAADAVTASAGIAFEQNFQGFERLSLGATGSAGTVDLANMNDISYVRTAGNVGTNAVYTIDLSGLVLNFDATNGGDTFSIAGQTVFTADADGEGPADAATGIDGTTVTFGGVTYDIDATDATAVTLTAQTASNVTGDIALTVGNESGDGASQAPTTNAGISPTTEGVAGADADLTLDNMASDGTVELTANGDLIVNVANAENGDSDSLNAIVTTATADLDAGTLTVADVETVNITSTDSQLDNNGDGVNDAVQTNTLDLNADSATSVVVDGNANLVLDVADSADVTTLNAADLTGALTVTATGNAAMTVTGGAGNDVLTAAGSGDVLNGGAGNDTLTGANLTQLTGGAGADTFMMNTPTNANSYSTITDLEAGDIIDLDAGNAGTVEFGASAVQLASTAVFQDYANAAVNQLGSDGNDAAWFQFGGDTYIVQSGNTAANDDFVSGADSIIQIAGEVDLSLASYNQSQGTLEIA